LPEDAGDDVVGRLLADAGSMGSRPKGDILGGKSASWSLNAEGELRMPPGGSRRPGNGFSGRIGNIGGGIIGGCNGKS